LRIVLSASQPECCPEGVAGCLDGAAPGTKLAADADGAAPLLSVRTTGILALNAALAQVGQLLEPVLNVLGLQPSAQHRRRRMRSLPGKQAELPQLPRLPRSRLARRQRSYRRPGTLAICRLIKAATWLYMFSIETERQASDCIEFVGLRRGSHDQVMHSPQWLIAGQAGALGPMTLP
jgi:hypothetical protein